MVSREVAIRVRGVSHQFGEAGEQRFVRALLDTSLEVARGELLCLIGPSGCGKSTLLNVIGGLTQPSVGTVDVLEKPVRGPLPRDIAFVFQENALFPWNTVIENIELGMTFQGVPKSQRAVRAKQSLAAVGLAEFAAHYPAQLSGGMRQRAALARALSLETPILLMDEPFGALDPVTRVELHGEFRRIQERVRKTVLIVTHDMREAFALATRIGVLDAGRLAAFDTPQAMKTSTDPRVRQLLDS